MIRWLMKRFKLSDLDERLKETERQVERLNQVSRRARETTMLRGSTENATMADAIGETVEVMEKMSDDG